jgi:antitoxin YefM
MTTVSLSKFRQSLTKHLDKAEQDCEEIIVTRGKGRKSIVLNYDDYMSLQETAYLLSSPANRKHLDISIKQAKKGNTITLTI